MPPACSRRSPHTRHYAEAPNGDAAAPREHDPAAVASVAEAGLLCRAVAVTASASDDGGGVVRGGDGDGGGSRPLANDEVFIPPSVAFNAGLGPFAGHVVLGRAHSGSGGDGGGGGGGGGGSGHHASLLHSPPPIARTASVSRVKRPRSTGGSGGGGGGGASTAKRAQAHALALMSFFSTPRVLQVGDVFGVSLPRPGGSGGGAGGSGVGCWWQELQEGGDDDALESDGEEAEDAEAGEATTATAPAAAAAAAASKEEYQQRGWDEIAADDYGCSHGSGRSVVTGGDGAAAARDGRYPPPRPRRATAAQRFQDAIVRQGSELVFFCVTELEGEVHNGSGGSGESLRGSETGLGQGLGLGSSGDRGSLDEEGPPVGCMVVSQHATELREGAPVCSPVPETSPYQRFVCRANGYPCPDAKAPLVSVLSSRVGIIVLSIRWLHGVR